MKHAGYFAGVLGFEVNVSLSELLRQVNDPPNVNAAHAVARIRGVNGNGKIIFAGAQIAKESQDGNAYEMSYTTEPRVRMPMSEVLVYVAVAAAIVVAAVLYRR